jgi:hypothetical protein
MKIKGRLSYKKAFTRMVYFFSSVLLISGCNRSGGISSKLSVINSAQEMLSEQMQNFPPSLLQTATFDPFLPVNSEQTLYNADPVNFERGYSFAAWTREGYTLPGTSLSLSNLKADGVEWISLIVTQYQDTIDDTIIAPLDYTPSDSSLVSAIQAAHKLGIMVMLKPQVDLGIDSGHWRGEIGENFTSEDWTAWFNSYESMILHYASLAQENGVEQFCIGTELQTTETQAEHWRSVARAIRGVYSGFITYAVNFDLVQNVSWWDMVDYIGIDAYYILSQKNDPSLAELESAWEPIIHELGLLSHAWGNKPILFTEIGYRSMDGASQAPWDYKLNNTLDLQEQADDYQAVFTKVVQQSWMKGIFWWSWDSDPYAGSDCNKDFSVKGKPAEEVLRRGYGVETPISRGVLPGPDENQSFVIFDGQFARDWDPEWSWDVEYSIVNDPDSNDRQVVHVLADPYGGLSLHHEKFDTSTYTYLEVVLQAISTDHDVSIIAHNQNDRSLYYRQASDCRYLGEKTLQPATWTRVLIPLRDLGIQNPFIQRFTFANQNGSGQSEFWIASIRLLGSQDY